jgi:hypothetical protein
VDDSEDEAVEWGGRDWRGLRLRLSMDVGVGVRGSGEFAALVVKK